MKKSKILFFSSAIISLSLILTPFGVFGDNLKIEQSDPVGDILNELRVQGETEGWTFSVGRSSASERTIGELCGLVEPDNWQESAAFDNTIDTTLTVPEKFDWRNEGGLTPVKNQGACGSCWAFGTTAALESTIKIKTGETVDLSEQWLVSCNRDGWGCNGGWWAHDYYAGTVGKCGGTGAVLESSFPYTASDSFCNGPYPHQYLLIDTDGDGYSWKFIDGQSNIPSPEQIKQAIFTYGPISVGVYVDSAFHMYDGGIFNSQSNGQVNHAVALVGWDDNQGEEGVWFLKNSWDTDWGENGYMRIEYGCNNVGYASCFIDGYRDLGPDNIDIQINLELYRLTNDPRQGDFDPIEFLPFDKPEWYYRVGVESEGEPIYQYKHNKKEDSENPGSWWDYAHEYTWYINQDHLFYTSQPTADVTIKLMEYDSDFLISDKDDLADVSQSSGGGVDDDTNDKRQAIYHGTYDVRTDELTGDITDTEGDHKTTMGDGKNNAKVWFRITDNYVAEKYEPIIDVDPDYLSYGEVSLGKHEKTFEIYNVAPKDPLDWAEKLKWTASTDKSWITLNKKSGTIAGSLSETVKVTIDTTNLEKGKYYTGNIVIDSNDREETIGVSLTVKKARYRLILPDFLRTYLSNFFIFYQNIIQKLHYT